MGFAVAVVSAVATIASTGFSIYSQSRANQNQESAQKAQQEQQELAAQRERVRAIRQTRIQRAAAVNAASQVGAQDSSSFDALGSLTTQLGSNLGYSTQQEALSGFASSRLQRAANFNERAAVFNGVTNLSNFVFNQVGGLNTLMNSTSTARQPSNMFASTP